MNILELERYRIKAGNEFSNQLYASYRSTFKKPIYISVVTGACVYKLLIVKLTKLSEPNGAFCFMGRDEFGKEVNGRYDYATNSGYIINDLAHEETMITYGPQEVGLFESFAGDESSKKKKKNRAYVRFTFDDGGFRDVRISSLKDCLEVKPEGRRYKCAKWYSFSVEEKDSPTQTELKGIYFPPLQLGFIESN